MNHPKLYDPFGLTVQALVVCFSVGAVVYHQAMTQLIANGLNLPTERFWVMSVATQLGYGLGLMIALPMGDKWPARTLIPGSVVGLGLVLLAQGLVQSLPIMVGLCALAGLFSVGGQLLIAHAMKTAPSERHVAIIGILLSALFGGLLFARFFGGWGGQVLGWRSVYAVVGVCCLLLAALLPGTLVNAPNQTSLGFLEILRKQGLFWIKLPELRYLSLIAACFFAASNGLWANLASQLSLTLHWQSSTIGLLALTSVFSIMAPWLARRAQLRMSLLWLLVIAALAIVLSAANVQLTGTGLFNLVVLLSLTDLSVRSVQALTQSRVLMINPSAASRLNSLYMTVFFGGAAIGSWIGGIMTARLGWSGLMLFVASCAILGAALSLRLSSLTKRTHSI